MTVGKTPVAGLAAIGSLGGGDDAARLLGPFAPTDGSLAARIL